MGVLAVFAAWVAARGVPKRWPALFPVGVALLVFADLRHAYGDYMPVSSTEDWPGCTRPCLPRARA